MFLLSLYFISEFLRRKENRTICEMNLRNYILLRPLILRVIHRADGQNKI